MAWKGTPVGAGRVTSADVLAIFKAPTGVTNLAPFITAADLLIDQHLADEGLSDALVKEISRWLSAHYACMRYQRLSSQKIGPAADSYQTSAPGKRYLLSSTDYGQQAIALDPTGKLLKLSKEGRHVPSISVLGAPTG